MVIKYLLTGGGWGNGGLGCLVFVVIKYLLTGGGEGCICGHIIFVNRAQNWLKSFSDDHLGQIIKNQDA